MALISRRRSAASEEKAAENQLLYISDQNHGNDSIDLGSSRINQTDAAPEISRCQDPHGNKPQIRFLILRPGGNPVFLFQYKMIQRTANQTSCFS